MNRATFGLRGASRAASTPAASAPPLSGGERIAALGSPVDVGLLFVHDASSVDEEVQAWKQQRSFTMPWKQLCLMASICFGIASFVLPENVNAAVNWLLYGLTAMSFWVWFKGRRARAKT